MQVSTTDRIRNPGASNIAGIPPTTQLPINPNESNLPPTTPFNPNQFPSSGNLIPNPTGSGEIEPVVPDIDLSPDPDFGQDLDSGTDSDTDQTQDSDLTKDPELPPDHIPDGDKHDYD
jgi:hypothetical protein